MSRWANFNRNEFRCRCGCERNEIRDELIDVVQDIRTEVNRPLAISSGYRCPDHPVESAKGEPGTHSQGMAADVLASHDLGRLVLLAALKHPKVGGVGVHQKGNGRFIHIDIAPNRSHLLWTY